jgi:membrane glycosyltransferase
VQEALAELRQDPELARQHFSSLPLARSRKAGQVDVDLAVARAKIDDAESFDEAVRFLTQREKLAVLKNRAVLEGLLNKGDFS